MSDQPTVSICICSYNHARYLPQTIDSVLTQTYQDFELIIVDDGSKDNSHKVLSDYQQRYPDKIRYVWHENHANRGISVSCNLAVSLAQGRLFAWLGSDDYWFPEKLATQVRFFDEHPEVGMLHTSALTLDANGTLFPVSNVHDAIDTQPLAAMVISNPVVASTAMMPTRLFAELGAFDENLVFSDWELWIRIAAQYPIGFLAEPSCAYRVHGQNVSISSKADIILKHNVAVIDTVAANIPAIDPTLKQRSLANMYLRAGLDGIAGGDIEAGRTRLKQAAEFLGTPLPAPSDEALLEAVVSHTLYLLAPAGWTEARCEEFLRAVFQAIAPQLTASALAKYHVTQAFIHHAQGQRDQVRRHVGRALRLQPSVTRNRGVLSIGVQAVIGPRAVTWLKGLKS
ncbi:MAG: glycosyltransferase [Thermoflexales bacterium]|nr:glycosyltransferase [Thermoflexales bacterium]